MKSLIRTLAVVCGGCVLSLLAPRAHALDIADGLMMAVPTQGTPPAMDGSDTGWDLSAVEPMWAANQTMRHIHGELALNYDDQALYLHARMALPNRTYQSTNSPLDPLWNGDEIELRLCSDPKIAYPLNINDPAVEGSDRVCHMSFWRNNNDHKSYVNIAYGGMHHNSRGKAVNPEGTVVNVIDTPAGYVLAAKIPWSVMHVPGGTNPFHAGDKMTATWGAHVKSPDWFMVLDGLYTTTPGDFAFLQWQLWGQVEFSAKGNLPPRHASLDQLIAKAEAITGVSTVGVPSHR